MALPDRLTGQTLKAPALFFIMRSFVLIDFPDVVRSFGLPRRTNTPARSKPEYRRQRRRGRACCELSRRRGHCSEALPLLTRTVAHITTKSYKRELPSTAFAVRRYCSNRKPLLDMLRVLNQHFPHDPEVLYLTVHAYSDLSSRAALELALTAPTSIPGLEMDAEANEVQGKWDEAEKDYRKILEENPRYPGIHFRLARLLLSRPNPAPDFQEEAKKELQQELEIDPANAGAEYVLGELARQAQDFPKRSGTLPRRRN